MSAHSSLRSRRRRSLALESLENRSLLTAIIEVTVDVVDFGIDFPTHIQEGQTLSQSGWITAAQPIEFAKVKYGDSPAFEDLTIGETGNFSLSHTYHDSGDYSVLVVVKLEDEEGYWVAERALSVLNVAPSVSISAPLDGYQGVRGQLREFQLNATDPSSVDFNSAFNYLVSWGDGTSSSYAGTNAEVASHRYHTAGSYTVSVTATDKDGATGPASSRVVAISATEIQGTEFAIGGTAGNDTFQVTVATTVGVANVTLNGAAIATVTSPKTVRLYGGTGNDTMRAMSYISGDTFEIRTDDIRWHGVKVTGDLIDKWMAVGTTGHDNFKDFGGIASVTGGGQGTDRVYSSTGGGTFLISGTNSGTLDDRITFDAITYLNGSTGNDTFKFTSAGSVSGKIDGGAGINTFDYSALTTTVTVSLQVNSAFKTRGFSNIQRFLSGTATNDRFTSPNTNNNWSITGPKTGDINGVYHFEGFETVSGGNGSDRFFIPDAAGPLFTSLDGLGGSDTLDYSNRTAAIQVDLQNKLAPSVPVYLGIEQFTGTSNIDTLIGLNKSLLVWTVTGADSGQVNVQYYSSFENLVGSTMNDTVQLRPGGSISGSFVGRGGVNTLDYGTWVDPVVLDLRTGVAPSVASILNVANVIGGAGNDILFGDALANNLQGGAGNDILSGEAGNDNLNGGAGRDILFGGAGVDIVDGSTGDDIIVGGTTIYTQIVGNGVDLAPLLAFRETWLDPELDFLTRTERIRNGVGTVVPYQLAPGTVMDDRAVDTLFAGTALGEHDWLIRGAKETVKNVTTAHKVTKI